MTAQQPEDHIKNPYTLAEIKTKIASNEYNAEMLLQHAMRLLEGVSLSANVGEPTKAQIREVFMSHGFTVKEGQTDLKQYVYDAAYALLALAAPQHTQAASELRRLHAENITLQSSTAPADVAGTSERWRERWHGSPTEQGWSIMHGRECIAYLGPDVSSEAVSAIVAAHNAAPTTQAAPAAQGDALDTARSLFDAGWKACARFCDRDDAIYDGIVGSMGCPEFETAFEAVWAAQRDKS